MENVRAQKEHGGYAVSRGIPKFPLVAKIFGMSGYVKLSFDISDSGIPKNIEVIEAKPPWFFNGAAKAALKQNRYMPALEKGVPVELKAFEQIYKFSSNEEDFAEEDE